MEIAQSLQSGTLPEVSKLPVGIRTIIEAVYGQAVADIFLVAVPLAIVTIVAILLLPNTKLGTKTAIQQLEENASGDAATETPAEQAEETVVEVAEALIGAPTGSIAAQQARPSDTQEGR